MPPVKTAPFDPADCARRFGEAAARHGFRKETYGQAGPFELFALTRRAPGPRPRIYLSSGIHGDEPAPPLALLSLLESGELDDRAVWFLCPLLNPLGLAAGTRESAQGIDLNRDFLHLKAPETRAHTAWLGRQPPFDVAGCVHEDWESTGYYLYELNPAGRVSLARDLMAAAEAVIPHDPSPVIEGREAVGGIIRPPPDPRLRELWPESIYLQANHTRLSYTIETPSAFPLDRRVAAHAAALRALIAGTVRDFRRR